MAAGESRYRSRTYWLCWGIVVLTFGLTLGDHVDAAGWGTVTLGVLAAWQLRRGWDNHLDRGGVP